ncbi:WAT1-related protein At1g44800-like [Dendrobium catenatum]|uniref:WAT1-related protein n=1 Tax=Dendrobium catenatum TaxID=906689 RepID=A0A2I0WGB4_9ASPA|nr:WAT1-related protein At1g44800-like [Dendrobium catenatum]PKU74710.1 WAT1-related protein [Dendrobium catenatum]
MTAMKTASGSSANLFQNLKPYVFIILLQFGYAGMYVITTATLKNGMNHYVLVVYRNLVAAAIIAPFALWFERKNRSKITPLIFFKIVALAMLEVVLDQNFYYMGAKLTNASFSAAFYNILPAMTFMLAILLRMEKINIRRRRSQAKVIGTAITLVGAILMILYKGPVVEFFWTVGRAQHHPAAAAAAAASQGGTMTWLKGTSMLFVSCISWSLFFILQSNTLESFPSELTLTTLICGIGALLSATVAFVMERGNVKPWIIGLDMRLFTAVYSGIVCSGVAYCVQGIVMKERGPVFVTAFNPLCMIVTAIMGSIIFAEEISRGRVIGAVIIVIGLYFLIWGKSNDHLASKKEVTDQLPVAMAATNGTKPGCTVSPTTHIEIPAVTNP